MRRATMRSGIIIAVVASLAVGSSLAQNTNPSQTPDPGKAGLPRINLPYVEPDNPAIKTTKGNKPGAPAAGANSFTETQAKSRIEARGYTDVSHLTKDERGVWRGTAQMNGKMTKVSLDFQGSVVVE
jgi:hypothetical protein